MKKPFLLLLATATAALTGCYVNVSGSSNSSDANLKASTNIVQSATIPADLKTLVVNNAFGAIHVTGAANGAFGWSQKLTVRARTDAAVQELAKTLLCRAELADGQLKLEVKPPDHRGPHHFQSDLEMTVPKSVVVQTRDQFGRTDVSGMDGDVEAVDQFGAMDMHDINGHVKAETSYGALTASRIGPATLRNQFGAIKAADIHGPLDAKTSYALLDASKIGGTAKLVNQFGPVRLEQAGDADVRTSYAELRVKDITGDAHLENQFGRLDADDVTGAVRAETSYGPMHISGGGGSFVCRNQFGGVSVRATSETLTNLEARTSYSTLEVRLPAGLKPAVRAHTSYADIESDFPVLMKPGGQGAFAGQPPGTPRVNLQNQNGKIRVVAE